MSLQNSGLARLVHDVGKYIARAARNLPGGPVPEPIVQMLVDDLYALDGKRRAREVFEAIIAEEGIGDQAVLDSCRKALARIDALESQVRGGRQQAIREAARHARQVEETLRQLATGRPQEVIP